MAQNPWLTISASDYEAHMGPSHADQLAPLSRILGDVCRTVRPQRVALLGCATGNGLEHIEPSVTRKVVAIDVNPEYVEVVKARYQTLGSALEVRCEDLASCVLSTGDFDLVHVALLFEYVDPAVLIPRIATWLAPEGVCACVIQLEGDVAPVTPSPYASMAMLKKCMRLVSPAEIVRLFGKYGLAQTSSWEVPLKGGKRFHVSLYAHRFG
jgi:SAM-dependent methyltransferase